MNWRTILFLLPNFIIGTHTHTEPLYDTFTHTNAYGARLTCDNTQQDDRFLIQCDKLSKSHAYSLRPYTLQEMCARTYASWSAQDFIPAITRIIDENRARGYSRYDAEKQILEHYELYCIPGFIQSIKTLENYQLHIKELHQRLVDNKGHLYKIKKFFGLVDQRYVELLATTEKLHHEILEQEKIESKTQQVARQKEFLARVRSKQTLRARQDTISKTFDSYRDELAQEARQWQELQDIYWQEKIGSSSRIERRMKALDTINHEQCNYNTQSYVLSPAATVLLSTSGNNPELYQTNYGNQLQQVIHQECIDGAEYIATLSASSVIHAYKNGILQCIDAARDYNQAGLPHKAAIIHDFCWSLLDYGKAIAQGAIDGVVAAALDIVEHPAQAVMCAVAGEYVLAYQLSKVLYSVADIGITALFDADHATQKWDDYIAPVTQLIDAVQNKQFTLRDALKGATHLAVQWKTQEKLLSSFGKICTTAKARAIEFAHSNPLKTPQEYMATPDGIVLKAIKQNPDSKVQIKNVIEKQLEQAHILTNHANINQTCQAVLKNGYYEVNGFKFTEYYYNKLWTQGRPAPSLLAGEILREAKRILPDHKPGFMRYETDGWEMIFNPITREVHHLQPIYKK